VRFRQAVAVVKRARRGHRARSGYARSAGRAAVEHVCGARLDAPALAAPAVRVATARRVITCRALQLARDVLAQRVIPFACITIACVSVLRAIVRAIVRGAIGPAGHRARGERTCGGWRR
jgi:hypothetical protein